MRGPARLAETFKNFKNLRISHSHVKIWPLLSTFAAMTFFRQSQVRGGKLAGTFESRFPQTPADSAILEWETLIFWVSDVNAGSRSETGIFEWETLVFWVCGIT